MDRAGINDFVSKLANSASELPAKSFDSSRPESKVFSNFATQTAGKSFDSSSHAESKVFSNFATQLNRDHARLTKTRLPPVHNANPPGTPQLLVNTYVIHFFQFDFGYRHFSL